MAGERAARRWLRDLAVLRLRRFARGRARRGATEELVVCFGDLVGFTSLGGRVAPVDLALLAGRLAELARELVREPVCIVKMVGDAVLLASPEAPPLVDTALSLIEAASPELLQPVRCGIAGGPSLWWEGDLYGDSVNRASHVTAVAEGGVVLCTKDVRDAAAEHFEWSYAGRHRIKGVPQLLPLYRAHWLRASDSGSPDHAVPPSRLPVEQTTGIAGRSQAARLRRRDCPTLRVRMSSGSPTAPVDPPAVLAIVWPQASR
jgi:class 3 adenylate cyclase